MICLIDWNEMDTLYGKNKNKILIDIKSVLDKNSIEDKGFNYWRL